LYTQHITTRKEDRLVCSVVVVLRRAMGPSVERQLTVLVEALASSASDRRRAPI
jgi:hypothetical protein